MINREQIYSRLFDLWPTIISGIITRSRRLKHWSDVQPSEQPALFQVEGDGVPTRIKGLPTKWILGASLYLYTNCGQDPSAIPGIQANQIMDTVEAALAYDTSGFQTLGGLVEEVRFAGHVRVDEGLLGPQSVILMGVEIVAA